MGSHLPADEDDDFYDSMDDEEFMLAETITKHKREHLDDSKEQPPSKRLKTEPLGDAATVARNILQKVWGFPAFRLRQEEVIARLISGGSAAVVFPTGGGKSLTYQIPALAFDDYDERCGRPPGGGITLVVSPLIALMKDQVDALRKRGITTVASMDSSQTRDSWLETGRMLKSGQLKLLYVAPERLNNEGFIAMINSVKVRMVAVDEAHCISEWGHAFRPDYLKVARFVKEVQAERVLCLTATAAPKVSDDICAAFGIDKEGLFRTTTYRSNLHLLAQSFTSGKEKLVALKEFLGKHKGSSIVYVQTHDQTESVCAGLKSAGFNAHGYHAGMVSEARTRVQDLFMKSKNIVIVATIAFGMGIDKSDIRNIIHYAVPKTLEGYSQEIGRAGRDGLQSTCMIYLCAEDIGIMQEWSRADVPSFRSVKGLVAELLDTYTDSEVGDIIERNLNGESKEWDIRKNALDLLNAQLELRFELIRAITPKYSSYKFLKAASFESMTKDASRATKALKAASKTATKWTMVDVDRAAGGDVTRQDAVRKLQEWNDSGAIELQPSGVVHRFRVMKHFPRGEAAKASVYDNIYKRIEEKEKEDMERIEDVITLITSNACLSRKLARHFGDEQSVPEEGCGHCQFCLTKTPVPFARVGTRKGLIDHAKVKAILAACKVRDDPRFLARIGFGISSPRVTTEKLGKHEVFGSLSDCDFECGCSARDTLSPNNNHHHSIPCLGLLNGLYHISFAPPCPPQREGSDNDDNLAITLAIDGQRHPGAPTTFVSSPSSSCSTDDR